MHTYTAADTDTDTLVQFMLVLYVGVSAVASFCVMAQANLPSSIIHLSINIVYIIYVCINVLHASNSNASNGIGSNRNCIGMNIGIIQKCAHIKYKWIECNVHSQREREREAYIEWKSVCYHPFMSVMHCYASKACTTAAAIYLLVIICLFSLFFCLKIHASPALSPPALIHDVCAYFDGYNAYSQLKNRQIENISSNITTIISFSLMRETQRNSYSMIYKIQSFMLT